MISSRISKFTRTSWRPLIIRLPLGSTWVTMAAIVMLIVSDRAVMPVTASLSGTEYRAQDMLDWLSAHVSRLRTVPAEKALSEIGSPKVLNLILLGAALQSGALGLDESDLRQAVLRRIPERFHELNLRALAWAGEN